MKSTEEQDSHDLLNDRRRKIEALAEQLWSLQGSTSPYSFADFSEDLKCECAREGIAYDTELITEIITQHTARRIKI